MSAIEGVAKTISMIIAPVVMVTACALMVNGLIVRYGAIDDRVRNMDQELSNLGEVDLDQNPTRTQRLRTLEILLPKLLKHHHYVHDALFFIYLSILVFMLDMLVIAVAVATQITLASQVALFIFLIGIGILFWGITLIARELRTSHFAIQFEVHRHCSLCQNRHPQSPQPRTNLAKTKLPNSSSGPE